LGFNFFQMWQESALYFDNFSIKSLISLIKLISNSIKSQNLSILQLNPWLD